VRLATRSRGLEAVTVVRGRFVLSHGCLTWTLMDGT
jgi:hypothetical protein